MSYEWVLHPNHGFTILPIQKGYPEFGTKAAMCHHSNSSADSSTISRTATYNGTKSRSL
jgi:hypothetical protein